MKTKQNIKKVVLTGGPCAGKSTALSIITQKLEKVGWKVFTCEETATQLFRAGVETSKRGPSATQLQEQIILRQIYEEDFLENIAHLHTHKNIVLLMDRGIMDGLAYIPRTNFTTILKRHHQSIISVRDERYDAVLHLVTAAIGAESFYSKKSNKVRREDAFEAIEKDNNTKNAWIGHPHMRVIDNSTSFKKKMDRVIQEIFSFLGLPVPEEIEKKFLIQCPNINEIPVPYQIIDIQQHYLEGHSPKEQSRIRKRGQYGCYTYYHTKKINIKGGVNMEWEDKLSQEQYYDLFTSVDQKLSPITKQRICFLWKNQYFEMDIFKNQLEGIYILEIELTSEQQEVLLPPWIQVVKEVTNDIEYSNYSLAKR